MKVSVYDSIFGAYVGEYELDDTNYPQEEGKKYLKIHLPNNCLKHYCPFHRPSKHHMRDWPISVRMDRSGLVERVCSCGIGHPDPDSFTYLSSKGITGIGVHSCCGHCTATGAVIKDMV